MPDSQQTADVVATVGATVGKGSIAAMGLFAAARILVTLAKRLGLSEDLASAQARDRELLQTEHREERARWKTEMDEMRARVSELEESLRHAELEAIAREQRIATAESERDALRVAWDPERTLPPGLR